MESVRISTDAAGRVVESSPAAAGLLLIQPRYLVGKPLVAFVVDRDRRRFRTALLSVARTGEDGELDLLIRRRDGSVVPADVSLRPRANGGRRGLVDWTLRMSPAVVADEEEAVRPRSDRERTLQRLFARFPYGVLAVRRDLRSSVVNPAARRAQARSCPSRGRASRSATTSPRSSATARTPVARSWRRPTSG